MTEEKHDIPEWYLPDGETLLGDPRGEHEEEHYRYFPTDVRGGAKASL